MEKFQVEQMLIRKTMNLLSMFKLIASYWSLTSGVALDSQVMVYFI